MRSRLRNAPLPPNKWQNEKQVAASSEIALQVRSWSCQCHGDRYQVQIRLSGPESSHWQQIEFPNHRSTPPNTVPRCESQISAVYVAPCQCKRKNRSENSTATNKLTIARSTLNECVRPKQKTKAWGGLFAPNSHPELLNDPFRSVFWIFISMHEQRATVIIIVWICRTIYARIRKTNKVENEEPKQRTHCRVVRHTVYDNTTTCWEFEIFYSAFLLIWVVFPSEYSIRLMIWTNQCWLSKVEITEAYKARVVLNMQMHAAQHSPDFLFIPIDENQN